ncbi:leucine-rich repeat SHOC-2-like [Chlorella sorokiniana]|uniref:Leucine-rich repeat SHOC-2-like n=1 Tax=Chlorella sorokiniana TaxID=3076 RepID=A0A2P6TR51_CHLSO|nr:leucine-rich repeat SHOC-2-like [Chlorella sorokiniana]|eukprot:PRW56545.1 leucine-rich repeat SHOC-2-like [Chlorella sorokiniana]
MAAKRHQPEAAAAPPALTINDLPDACLVQCLVSVDQEERFTSVALVSKRFHSLTCSPELLRELNISIWGKAAAAPRLEALRSWLLRHTSSMGSLELMLGCHSIERTPLLDGCMAAAISGGAVQHVSLELYDKYHAEGVPYTLGSWAASAASLRRLAVSNDWEMCLAFPLDSLSQLEHLELSASSFTVSPAARLPPNLARLEVCQTRPNATQAVQIGHLRKLKSLVLSGAGVHGLMDCPGALVAGLPSLCSCPEHLSVSSFPAGPWLPAAAQHLAALQTLELRLNVACPDEERPAWHANINAALAHMSHLTALWLEGHLALGCPAAIAGMACLERLCWFNPDWPRTDSPLPHGTYQRSMRHLVPQSHTAQLSAAALAGMPQLERLSLNDVPCLTEPSVWQAFWGWAEQHAPLRCLEFVDEDADFEDEGKVPMSTLHAMVHLAGRRPALLIRGLPREEEEGVERAPYREDILREWK